MTFAVGFRASLVIALGLSLSGYLSGGKSIASSVPSQVSVYSTDAHLDKVNNATNYSQMLAQDAPYCGEGRSPYRRTGPFGRPYGSWMCLSDYEAEMINMQIQQSRPKTCFTNSFGAFQYTNCF
jgi:hypothetical protein